MTEPEWWECDDSLLMLEFLVRWRSDRKARLFVVACCRRIGHLLNEGEHHALEVAERFCDRAASVEELAEAAAQARSLLARSLSARRPTRSGRTVAAQAALRAGHHGANLLRETMAGTRRAHLQRQDQRRLATAYEVINWKERAAQADLLRDIFGPLPFHHVVISRDVLTWNDGTVKRLADGIYDTKRFENLPILADALIDAGCDDEDILSHLRSPGPHARGCWALDLLLARE